MPGPELPRAAIADAGPLIHLDELGCLEVLDGFAEVIVPSVVAAEASRHRLDWQERAPACVVVRDPAAHLVRQLLETTGSRDLDAGELAAMALWLDHREAVLLCDDLAARHHAERMGCDFVGSLGLLLWSGRTGRLPSSEVRELIERIPSSSTLHIRTELLERVLRELDTP